MNDLHIQVKNLSKTYRVPVRPEGSGGIPPQPDRAPRTMISRR